MLRSRFSRTEYRSKQRCMLSAAFFSFACLLAAWASEPAAPSRRNQLPPHCSAPPGWEKTKTADGENCVGHRADEGPPSNCRKLQSDYLIAFTQEMEDLKEPMMLTRGTLLGWYRGCNLWEIPGDDIDVAVFPSGWNSLSLDRVQARAVWASLARGHFWQAFQFWAVRREVHVSKIKARGNILPHKTYHAFGVGGGFLENLGLEIEYCQFDIWVYHANQTHWISYGPEKRSWVYKKVPLQAVSVDLPATVGDTITVYVPRPTGVALAEAFGEDWEHPIEYDEYYQAFDKTKRIHGLDTVWNDCVEIGERAVNPLFFYVELFFMVVGSSSLVAYFRARKASSPW